MRGPTIIRPEGPKGAPSGSTAPGPVRGSTAPGQVQTWACHPREAEKCDAVQSLARPFGLVFGRTGPNIRNTLFLNGFMSHWYGPVGSARLAGTLKKRRFQADLHCVLRSIREMLAIRRELPAVSGPADVQAPAEGSMKAYRLSILLIPLLPLMFMVSPAKGSELLTDPGSARQSTGGASASATGNFHLKGVLVSDSGGLALINGKMSRVGDRVAGAEIVAIVEGAVRLLIGSRELTVNVGSSFDTRQTFHASIGRSQRESRPESVRASNRPTGEAAIPPRVDQHAVSQGETLSGISKRYQVDGVTLNQMMIAFFRVNPKAFDENINILFEGASLRIPTRSELLYEEPDMATAQVGRQTHQWRMSRERSTTLAKAENQTHYGPVGGGETLIVIADHVRPVEITVDQMMIALFEANREAFGDNINLLYKDSVLRIPDDKNLLQQAEIATAEVTRQMDEWRSDDRRQARLDLRYADTSAASF